MIVEDNLLATDLREPETFEEFCRRVHPRLVRSLALYCGDAPLAEDLAQEALAIACRDWAKTQRRDSPEAWVHRVGMNLAHSWFRRARIGRERMGRPEPAPTEDSDTQLSVRAVVARLPRRQRQALVLRYFVDLSVADTAAAMACEAGTVRALTSQAIQKLREQLADTWEVEE